MTRPLHFVLRRARWFLVVGRFVLRGSGVKFGKNLKLGSPPHISRSVKGATIVIGDNVMMNNELAENPAGAVHKTSLVAATPTASLRIGNNVGISGAIIVAWSSVEIGDDALRGAGCNIYDIDFHGLHPEKRTPNTAAVQAAPVVLEPRCWIGANATVLKGVRVGRDSIVGACALMTRDVPLGAIVGGVPAKVIGWAPTWYSEGRVE